MEKIAPRSFALPEDPVGLQCGKLDRRVRRMMLSLDASLKTVRQAVESKADLLVTHHPLLFEPLVPETMGGSVGRVLALAIREELPVYSAHTNLDASPQGINASLANLLDLRNRRFIQPCGSESFKLVVFVPGKDLERVRAAAFDAGGGRIGQYRGCSFTVEGVGTFHAEEGASPTTGRAGRDEKVREVRLEISVPSEFLGAVLSAVRKTHPYEEPAVDVYPTASGNHGAGIGITGSLPERQTVGQVAARVGSKLKPGSLRLVGVKGRKIESVAVCAGSGASLLDAAADSGAQLYITGDIKYHDARRAEDAGMNILDVGHFAPERYGINRFGKLLGETLARQGLQVNVLFAKETDPFRPV